MDRSGARQGDGPDPYGTASLRERVLAAWAASPARFREDANAEEDLLLGAYRDRLVVELAQNAADAAARAGRPGRLLLRLEGERLSAANTGATLDPAGVEALSTLRASAKRDDPGSVGRFGVGFSAVRTVADEVAVLSAAGGVGWSLEVARREVGQVPELVGELVRRGNDAPMLRLPFPVAGEVLEGFDTVVLLGLRDADAVALVRRQLEEVDAALLLTLPALAEVVVEVHGRRRRLHATRVPEGALVEEDGTRTRWRVHGATGELDPALLADLPVEQRARSAWQVLWAVPVDERGVPARAPGAAVLHAPTPTAEPLDLPALLVGSFPLDSTRRLVAPGPLRDFLVQQAAQLYADLACAAAAETRAPELLDLVPGPVPAGALDGQLRAGIVAALGRTPLVPAAGSAQPLLRLRDAVVVEGADAALLSVLSEVLPDLADAAWSRRWPVLARLGARMLRLADVADALADLRREPAWWRRLYAALASGDLEALGALPVPLADGRLVRGPRGLLLPGDRRGGGLPTGLDVLGLRVVHPDAAHPVLERLGARPATPAAVLAEPAARAAVAGSLDADPAQAAMVADAVLALAASLPDAAELPDELVELALPDEDGELAPAGELVLPGSRLAGLIEPDALGVVAPALVERWGPELLERVGVLGTFALVRDRDVEVDPDTADHDLDGEDAWLDELARTLPPGDVPPVLVELAAVRDLDLVRPPAWPEALRLLASSPSLRAAVVEPALAVLPGGARAELPSYTAWWLREHPVVDGRPPAALRDPAGDPALAGLYDDAPALGLDPVFVRALGLRTTLPALLAEPGGAEDLLDRLTDPRRRVGRRQLRLLYASLAGVDPGEVTPRDTVRVPDGEGSRVVAADGACVLDLPHLAQLDWPVSPVRVPLAAAADLADVLGLPLASELRDPRLESAGSAEAVPAVVRRVLPDVTGGWRRHGRLLVDGQALDWWVEGGVVHATGLDGLARGLAWAAGAWERRLLVAAVLAAPVDRVDALLAEAELGLD